ncbi:MAG: class I SAM-dependent methyltransferase [Candidatus Margulisbacteria bacterium]|nr:class I SAM-dependent methyltransferase [Candidatus Margulisiibacteriota bacterium]
MYHMENISENKWNIYNKSRMNVNSWTDNSLMAQYLKGRVLDMGCSSGVLLSKIKGVTEKYGIDLSRKAIQKAQKRDPSSNFFVADVCHTLFPNNYFDFVYSLEVLEHILDPSSMLKEIKRILKPGGYGYIQTPNYPIKRLYDFLYWLKGDRESALDDYTHISKLSSFAIKKLIAKEFEIINFRPRNIILEKRIPFIQKMKNNGNFIGNILGQKIIVIFKKV